ncbi:MAG: mechanosensitive ion channel family protein [Planctomycetota bacterium]
MEILNKIQALNWQTLLESGVLTTGIRVLALLVIGLPVLRAISALCRRLVARRFSQQSAMLVQKGVFYGGGVLVLIMVLQELGFSLAALIGAAGVAGIAIGFAAQTSLSNIISGLFLISERPFEVGDIIRIGDTTGIVLSIDLLSVKMRRFDNTFVRVPNETLVKSELTNITRFPIRRFDLNLGVAYGEDIERAVEVLKEVARDNPWALDEPQPMIAFTDFGDSALEIFFGVWFAKTDYLALRDSILPAIKKRFDQEGIEIPFPHRTLYVGEHSEPFPVQMVQQQEEWGDESSDD